MTKRQLIDEILERNTTADAGFLARFDDSELDEYLAHLRRLQLPRLTGDASRYEKYFQFNVPAARPIESPAQQDVCPCLPEEEADVDDSFWHLDQDFESDDEEVRRRVDRFAEQLLDRMTDEGDLPDDDDFEDDGGGAIVYHRNNPSLDGDGDDDLEDSYEDADQDDAYDDASQEEEETLQEAAARSASPSRDHDSWLF